MKIGTGIAVAALSMSVGAVAIFAPDELAKIGGAVFAGGILLCLFLGLI